MHRIAALVFVFFMVGVSDNAYSQGVFATACGDDDHIGASKRQVVDSAALQFMQTLLGSSPVAAYGMFFEAGKKKCLASRR